MRRNIIFVCCLHRIASLYEVEISFVRPRLDKPGGKQLLSFWGLFYSVFLDVLNFQILLHLGAQTVT